MRCACLGLLLQVLALPAVGLAQKATKSASGAVFPREQLRATAAATPFTETRVHRVGNMWLNVGNYGMIGGLNGPVLDPCTGRAAPSLEFPAGSGTINLWEGSLWVGAVKDRDTLVSVGAAIWPVQQHELLPRAYPEGRLIERTTRSRLKNPPGWRCDEVVFDEEAVSEYDIIARYTDTLTSSQFVLNDPDDGRGHIPLGIEITQRSYQWSLPYAQDFVLIDYEIRNIGDEYLRDAYVGYFLDQDIHHNSTGDGWLDDIAGFLRTYPSTFDPSIEDTINAAWAADNDGDPVGGRYIQSSNTNVSGMTLQRLPASANRVSFNWFVGNDNSTIDWGPVSLTSQVQFIRSGTGAPHGDVAKYQMMSNGEHDYDQMEAAISHVAEGWFPQAAGAEAANIADGWDTRYLISAGPFDLPIDSSEVLTVALVAGENFHTLPSNFTVFWDPNQPRAYRDRLDFSDFALNAKWAGWVYDTPGFDTDGDGYRGESRLIKGEQVFYRGDGVPDFSGPPPPPAPDELSFSATPGMVRVHWNGRKSETTKDPFSNLADFEGYRVYMSRTGLAADFQLLTQRDNINYTRYEWSPGFGRWRSPDPPFTLDSLKALYDAATQMQYGRPFHPDDFKIADPDSALRIIRLDPNDPGRLDTLHYYFGPFDANLMPDDDLLAGAVADGIKATGVIRKLYPGASPDSLARRADGSEYAPFYEYEFAIDGLQVAEPIYFAVTVFDYGHAGVGLDPLETSPLSNAEQVWPINSAAVVKQERPRPGVYPNPYRLIDDYNASGWEDTRRQGLDPERARKVTFTNVPDTCTISIWSLDGDLVRRLDHAAGASQSDASVVVWNLITRNTQAVKSGLYLWTIESRFGTDIGKLVIIK